MTLFVYPTETCSLDARKHSLTDEVQRFAERVEKTQSTSLFDPFPQPWLVKKKMGGRQGRLIAELRHIGEHSVVVLLTILIRGSRDYEGFSDDPVGYGKKHFPALVDDAELHAWLAERSKLPEQPSKRDPSPAEYTLLYNAFAHRDGANSDVMVCETGRWVDTVMKDKVSKQLNLLADPCIEALGLSNGLQYVKSRSKSGWGVWVLKTDQRLLLICAVTPDADAVEAEACARKVDAELAGQDPVAILRTSRRAYPSMVLTDEELWIDLELEPLANFALSPEESEVLESARRTENPFPLFINGRAGSGKSTILQYLFADILFTYLTMPEARELSPPIYLTANGELLRIAREFVRKLLKSEAIFAQRTDKLDEGDVEGVLNDSFREFYAYVLSRIPSKDRKERFAHAGRIDYARFRALWSEKFGKDQRALRDHGPDLCWHVIRTYIKGMSSESLLEPEDYTQIPEKQRTVTDETYKLIYEKVWPWYEGVCEANGLWDDQDLVRYVLDHGLAQAIHPAVVTDESQDFTRLELEFLLRINLFSDRALPAEAVGRVCFAFAGDQFQTLNPTGFRWDAIKATFVEKFIYELDVKRRADRPDIDLNYVELQYNYRSSHRIVRFSNHVQAIRAALFQLPDLRPQTPWTTDQRAFQVSWFRSNDGAFWKNYRDNPGIVVIIPCHEGEEATYVQNDPILREHIQTEAGVPLNVLSASRAKGCEYPIVVCYGFGAAAEEDVHKRIANPEAQFEDAEDSLALQYFINRVYVAVSRPKRRLLIVDSEEGLQRLWKSMTDEVAEANMIGRLKRGQDVWAKSIEGMIAGTAADLGRDDATDPLDTAQAFEREGVMRCDAFLMMQASHVYRALGRTQQSRICRAQGLEFQGSLREAGEVFIEANMVVPEAVHCLWRAGAEGRAVLADLARTQPHISSEIEVRASQLLQGKPTAAATLDFLTKLAARLEDPVFVEQSAGTPVWREVLSTLLKAVVDPKLPQTFSLAEWMRFARLLGRIWQAGLPVAQVDAAPVYYAAGMYAEAAKLWEEGGATRGNPDYTRAKAESEPYPQRVVTLASMQKWDEIVKAHREAAETELTLEQGTAVSQAYRERGDLEKAARVAFQGRVPSQCFQIVLDSWQKDGAFARKMLHAGILSLIAQRDWDQFITLVRGDGATVFAPVPGWTNEKFQIDWMSKYREEAQATAVRAMARDSRIAEAPEQVQRRWQEFLRDYLRVKGGTWRAFMTAQEAGAAIERAGRFTDAIGFYEALRGERRSEEDTVFAKTRWLVAKNRQLQYERGQRAASGKTRAIEREMQQIAVSLKIASVGSLDRFPELPPLYDPKAPPAPSTTVAEPAKVAPVEPPKPETTPTPVAETPPVDAAPPVTDRPPAWRAPGEAQESAPELPRSEPATAAPAPVAAPVPMPVNSGIDRVEMRLGGFDLDLARSLGRINITKRDSMETAFIKVNPPKCGGEAEFEAQGEGSWRCAAWRVKVNLHEDEAGQQAVDIASEELGILVRFSI